MTHMTAIHTKTIIEMFKNWLSEAEGQEPNDPTAMALATATPDGMPSLRMVLLKNADIDGFVFYTNLGSHKARELAANPKAALLFHWKSLRRQVRVEGDIVPVTDAEADTYFASRPRASQIGAWASVQSETMDRRFILERRVAKFTAKFNIGAVPRPDFWSGFRLVPARVEFWSSHRYRLHDRTLYVRGDGDTWSSKKLYP
jgi:pyridoxamine 5'-phosphate oxidase